MSEETFYSRGNIHITNARAVLGGKTYAMANITSVAMAKRPANRTLGIVVALVGIILAACGGIGDTSLWIILGVLALLTGIVMAVITKPSYIVRLGSASGESDALSSKDQEYIREIVGAVNEAIVRRG